MCPGDIVDLYAPEGRCGLVERVSAACLPQNFGANRAARLATPRGGEEMGLAAILTSGTAPWRSISAGPSRCTTYSMRPR